MCGFRSSVYLYRSTLIFPPYLILQSSPLVPSTVIFKQIKILNLTLILCTVGDTAFYVYSYSHGFIFFLQILLAYHRVIVVITVSTCNSNSYDDLRGGCNKLADGHAIDQLDRRHADVVLSHIRIHVQVNWRMHSTRRILRRKVRLSRQVGRTAVLHW